MKLTLTEFKVTNFRNIDDSNWIPFEQVTALVGRNESGKTAILQALYKFNPADKQPYNPQREFPRDRFAKEFRGTGSEFPVCAVRFTLQEGFREELDEILQGNEPPKVVTCTRYYDNSLSMTFDSPIADDTIFAAELTGELYGFEKAIRRIKTTTPEMNIHVQEIRTKTLNWATGLKDKLSKLKSLRSDDGAKLLAQTRLDLNGLSKPENVDAIESLIKKVEQLIARSKVEPVSVSLKKAVEEALPVFIYFENYGILDSAVYLPRLLDETARNPLSPNVRTVNAMFKHVGLTAKEISQLGTEKSFSARQQGQPVTDQIIAEDQKNKELREIKLNSASISITKQFNEWYGQRRHLIRYQADGDYFRIWVSDDKRPEMEIELESRSKGFQWFFSFYLVFLVESLEGHKDAILLLDEPGLNLHPTPQQELLGFFDRLSIDNPLMYTTHSPFLIDGDHIHRVRPVKEDKTGHSQITVGTWPEDRETIFPLQAAAGYAMVKGLFQHKKNILVEGLSDYLYLHSLNLHCHALKRVGLPDDVYITPCGGTKNVGYIASLFLGQEVRPVVLLDSDDAGRDRYKALLKELYAGHEKSLLLLSDILGLEECETEDLIGEDALLPELKKLLGQNISLNKDDRKNGGVIDHIKVSAKRNNIELPDGWKGELARLIAVSWSTRPPEEMPVDIIDRAEKLFISLNAKFVD